MQPAASDPLTPIHTPAAPTEWRGATRRELAFGLGLYLCLGLAWAALSAGIGGFFIFDDSWNLRGLEQIDRNPVWQQWLQFVLNGISSELGRPLTLLTFAAQYASWPWHPADFARVNVLLHLLNGCLLFWALLRLVRLLRLSPGHGSALALIASALWMITPLQASTVLYVVQRMAVLAGTFVILGTLLYLVGRERLEQGRPRAGLWWMSAGIGIGVGVGVLAKENAALLPLALLALEYTLLASLARGRLWRTWALGFLVAPSILLAGYLVIQVPYFQQTFDHRDFSLSERVLTETRILFVYLHKLAAPSINSIRLLYDDVPLSRSLLEPATTGLSVLAWVALVWLALRWRTRAPALAFGVLWYLAHHLLESTVIPLELAFEHRNYVAAIGPVWAAAWYGAALYRRPESRRLRLPLAAAGAGYLAFQLTALWLSASLWTRALDLAQYWARTQPDSVRAQMQLADMSMIYGDLRSAVAVLESAAQRWPGDFAIPLALMEMGCGDPKAPVPDEAWRQRTARNYQGQVLGTINMLDRLLLVVEDGACPRYSPEELHDLVRLVASIPQFDYQRRNLLLLHSRIAEHAGNREAAAAYLDEAITANPQIPMLRQGVVWAMEAGDLARAHRYVAAAEGIRVRNPLKAWSLRLAVRDLRDAVELYARDFVESE